MESTSMKPEFKPGDRIELLVSHANMPAGTKTKILTEYFHNRAGKRFWYVAVPPKFNTKITSLVVSEENMKLDELYNTKLMRVLA